VASVSSSESVLAVRCPCGLELAAGGEDDLVPAVNQHLVEFHGRAEGYDREQVIFMAYRRPA
jgi:hypothetical protein